MNRSGLEPEEVEDDDEEDPMEFVPKKRNDGTLLASDPPRPLPPEMGMGPSRPLPPTPEENQATLVNRRPQRSSTHDMPRNSVLPDLLPQTSPSTDPDVSIV